MTSREIDTYIFDLDGTLLYTLTDIANAANQALRDLGLSEFPERDFKHFVGGGVKVLAQRIREASGGSLELDVFVQRFKELYAKNSYAHSKPYSGILESIQELQQKGFQLAVLSNKPHEYTRVMVKAILGNVTWNQVIGAKADIPTKPDPTMLYNIMKAMDKMPDQCVYIGDSGTDMEAAKSAGVQAWGVTWGYRPESELRASGADRILAKPAEILP